MGQIFDVLLNRPLGALMHFLYSIFGNYAAAILFFAIAVNIIMLPLSVKQHRNQIRMAKIRPKEMAIREKYAGRTDTATAQKMNAEILAMHKSENYSQVAGCLPMLVQLPIIFALFRIVREPLTFVSRLSDTVIENIKVFMVNNSLTDFTEIRNIQQVDIVELFNDSRALETVRAGVAGLENFENVNYAFFGEMLTSSPQSAGLLSILMFIPLLNLATNFISMRLQKKITAQTTAQNLGKNMKIMEYTMPLLIVWMAYTWQAAMGLYWVFRSIADITQRLILAKIIPLPVITEEEYQLARQQYGLASVKKKKKKKKKPVEIAEAIETEIIEEAGETGEITEPEETIKETENSEESAEGE
ncbi:MAG: YidC/Oxa1 family membrane protein insertase [Oscillospiraceae bacterium]|nr:YidC/Oxa1 family membrane protein insertase [Oscillospiraceae bacterium]